MATCHLIRGKHIPHFDLNSWISTLSCGEFVSYFAASWKWYCLTFWNVKKSALFRRLFQYSVICHSSKYIGLALTDFNKNKVFYRVYMWLQLTQKIHRRKREKTSIYLLRWRHKNQKNIHLSTRSYDAMYRAWEGKSKLERLYRLFRELFCHIFWPQA